MKLGSRIKMCLTLATFLVAATAFGTPAYATNIALGKTVTGSTYYSSGSEVFPFDNIVDGSIADGGSPSNWNFWLTPNGQTGWVMVDLGAIYDIGSIEFLNTHNRGYNDRTTQDWTISILDSSLASLFSTSGTEPDLNMSPWTDPIPVTTIDLGTPVAGQYVRFDVGSYWGSSGGLNELRVYDAAPVPEPATMLLLGFGMGGLGVFRKKFKKA